MILAETTELLRRLRAGDLAAPEASAFETISTAEFASSLAGLYPITFQERRVGRKWELGLARSLKLELAVHRRPNALFARTLMRPVLSRCLFVSSYDGAISEITAVSYLRVASGKSAPGEVIVRMGRGSKLDKTPDGWALKPSGGRSVVLSEEFLAKRGPKFDALHP